MHTKHKKSLTHSKVLGLLALFLFLLLYGCKSFKTVNKETIAVAHRGAWKAKDLPPNSLAAFREAVNLKCAGSEFDVNMTLDDTLVITHGPVYQKMHIEKTPYHDLIAVKLPNGEKLPTLNEFIKAGITNNTSTRFFCEIKSSELNKERTLHLAAKTYQTFKDLNAQRMVTFISFDYEALLEIHSIDPNAETQYLNNNKSINTLARDGITGANFRFPFWQKNPEYIEQAKKKGLKINSGTVNDTIVMDWLLSKNFDYISSDEPEIVIERYNKGLNNFN